MCVHVYMCVCMCVCCHLQTYYFDKKTHPPVGPEDDEHEVCVLGGVCVCVDAGQGCVDCLWNDGGPTTPNISTSMCLIGGREGLGNLDSQRALLLLPSFSCVSPPPPSVCA